MQGACKCWGRRLTWDRRCWPAPGGGGGGAASAGSGGVGGGSGGVGEAVAVGGGPIIAASAAVALEGWSDSCAASAASPIAAWRRGGEGAQSKGVRCTAKLPRVMCGKGE